MNTPRRMPSALLAWAGGPSGRHARSEWLLGLGPLGIAALLPILGAVLRLQHCLAHGWSGREPFARMCYSDLANSVGGADLGRGLTAYLSGDLHVDQPPLSGALMTLMGGFVRPGGTGDLLTAQRWFLGLWAVLAFGLVVLMVSRARSIADHPGADPVMLALAPVTAFTVLLSPDVVGVALATLAIWAWSARRPWVTGIAIGLGALARTWPMLVLAVIAMVVLRPDIGPARRRDLARTLSAVVGALLVGFLPFATHLGVLTRLVGNWWRAPTGLGSVLHLPSLGGLPVPGQIASVLAIAGWVAALLLGAYFVTAARRPPTLAAAVLVVVAIVLVTGKSVPVQSSLWLVPLVALAGIRWRDVLLWSAAEGAHFIALWLYLGGLGEPTKGLPAGWYAVFLVIRLVAIGWLARQAWVSAPRVPGIEKVARVEGGREGWGVETVETGDQFRGMPGGGYPWTVTDISPVENPHETGNAAYPPVTERP